MTNLTLSFSVVHWLEPTCHLCKEVHLYVLRWMLTRFRNDKFFFHVNFVSSEFIGSSDYILVDVVTKRYPIEGVLGTHLMDYVICSYFILRSVWQSFFNWLFLLWTHCFFCYYLLQCFLLLLEDSILSFHFLSNSLCSSQTFLFINIHFTLVREIVIHNQWI